MRLVIINVQLYTFSGHILSSNMAWLPGFIQGCNFFFKEFNTKVQEQKVEVTVRKSGNDGPWNPSWIRLGFVDGSGVWSREMDG